MSGATDQVDNWVFDSLVNFLHGSIWKVPVVGFIEEKSVVFDPDSYNNMTEEKEAEFRKIHEEYKTVVDFMLTSFMDDLQVTPEQVEEACRVREHQNKTLPESHITKVALEQLWAAEDFTAFRRLMTRKNIDLQLQSLELLVAKYGVLSPALRSGDNEDPAGEDGEDDFLQVVIRYSDQLETFKCDYGADAFSPGFNYHRNISDGMSPSTSSSTSYDNMHNKVQKEENFTSEHSTEIISQSSTSPVPIQYHAMLGTSSEPISNISPSPPRHAEKADRNNKEQVKAKNNESLNSSNMSEDSDNTKKMEPTNLSSRNTINPCAEVPEKDVTVPLAVATHVSPTPPPSPSPPNEDFENSVIDEEVLNCSNTETESESKIIITENDRVVASVNGDEDQAGIEKSLAVKESQLIQLEEAEATIEEESNTELSNAMKEAEENVVTTPPNSKPLQEETVVEAKQNVATTLPSPQFDEKTAVEIASTAPEQRRLLTAVRKALEINPEESEHSSPINIPSSKDANNDEDLQKRREYLRAQRDKLIAMKKQEREKLLLANTSGGGGGSGQQSARPKSARAAQIALKNPNNMRAVSLNEKSLSARRALADRLKQELIEK